ncbi:hypothetical protein E7Z59_14900 [Robertkochia marina]|uniref:Uncharacterized protein n=1 Tax=Robertkochia marina TaxID=1227945 RepID=A0A4S3LXD8_9FLAO|nr:hypothetical protein [Robertkochia marina]THD65866.1 hypothetical protein E7Z59_14900 [Robertkochia marina]TRZ41369.1 hypothetical protein D3A96_13510 [Robertkochia marina]
MKIKLSILLLLSALFNNAQNINSLPQGSFDPEKDLLLANYDCKTDVDDLQSVAAFATLLADVKFQKVKYHAVAGAYGIQDGLYVPPNDLFSLAFGDHWSDAHEDISKAINRVKTLAKGVLEDQGDLWIAEAGQSDFSAQLVQALQADMPEVDLSKRIHIVQHSDWNEEVTSPASLAYVKTNTDYIKIPDGNGVGNGSPGFRSPKFTNWKDKVNNPRLIKIWELAIALSNRYNGKEGRYHNEAISAGGMDFSDTSEICWILGLKDIKDIEQFFNLFSE